MKRNGWVMFLIVLLVIAPAVVWGGGNGEKTGAKQKSELNLVWASDFDPGDAADQLGIDELSALAKIKVKATQLTEDSAVVASLINGNQDIGTMDVCAAVRAIQMGVPMKVIMPSNAVQEFTMVAQAGINSVKDFKGKKVAFHAPGSPTEVLPKMLVAKTQGIKDEDIDWVVLPESPNRAAAMLAKRIDVTTLEVADILTLQEAGNFVILNSFSDIAPEALSTVWVTTEKFYSQHPDLIKAFAVSMAKGYKKARADKAAWMAKARQITQFGDERLSKTYDIYLRIGMFPSGDILSQDTWDKMIKFYLGIGELSDPLSYDVVLGDVVKAAAAAIR